MPKKLAAIGAALAFVAFAVPALASASPLTSQQISSIVALLQSFGADASTIANVQASLTGQPSTNTPTASCVSLTNDLYTGETDAQTNGQVTRLQTFLGVSPITGYFGPLTEQAVQRYQSSHGIVSSGSPDTTGYGFVGPATKGSMGCDSTAQIPVPATGVNFTASQTTGAAPLATSFSWHGDRAGAMIYFGDGATTVIGAPDELHSVSHTYIYPGTYTARITPSSGSSSATVTVTGVPVGAPVISSISPSSGSAYTAVTLVGSGFSPYYTDVINFNGQPAVPSEYAGYFLASSSENSLTFDIPNTAGRTCPLQGCGVDLSPTVASLFSQPATLQVSVTNPQGQTSNSVAFTLTADPIPAPTCTLTPSGYTPSPYTSVPGKIYVTPNSSVTLNWASQNATTGVWASPNKSGENAGTSGSATFNNLTQATNYYSIYFSGPEAGDTTACSSTIYVDGKG